MIFYIPLLFCYLELFFQTLLKNITFLFDEFPQVADCMFPVFIFSLIINTNLKFVAVNLWCFLQIFLNISGFLGKPYEIIQLTLRIYGLFLAPFIGHVIASYLKLLNNMTEFSSYWFWILSSKLEVCSLNGRNKDCVVSNIFCSVIVLWLIMF